MICFSVTLPFFSLFGVPEPFSMPAAFSSRTAAGGVLVMKVKFEKGEQVRINEGPFANFNGTVDDVNEDRQTLKVMVSIFGRSTPVEIEFAKVDKMDAE